jgi:thioredoxin reductase (NADPH)
MSEHRPGAPGGVTELTDADFRSALVDRDLAVVDLYASWCGPCRLFAPVFGTVAARFPEVPFFKIDGDLNPECRSDLTIDNLPYLAAYRSGRFVEGVSTTSEEALVHFVEKLKAGAP